MTGSLEIPDGVDRTTYTHRVAGFLQRDDGSFRPLTPSEAERIAANRARGWLGAATHKMGADGVPVAIVVAPTPPPVATASAPVPPEILQIRAEAIAAARAADAARAEREATDAAVARMTGRPVLHPERLQGWEDGAEIDALFTSIKGRVSAADDDEGESERIKARAIANERVPGASFVSAAERSEFEAFLESTGLKRPATPRIDVKGGTAGEREAARLLIGALRGDF